MKNNIRNAWGRLGVYLFVCSMFLWGTAMGIEQPTYAVTKTDKNIELRQYVTYAIAETEVLSTFQEAGNVAFWKLLHYIQGENKGQTKISMTAPVGLQAAPKGQAIAMTAPVSQTRTPTGFRVSFTLPSTYTADSAPTPLDSAISLRQIPARRVAVLRYSGTWSESRYEEKKKALLAWISAQGLTTRGDPILARYNPPYTLWFLRRNEVQIEVE